MSVQLPEYNKVPEMMSKVGTAVGPAELHGLLCGFLCLGQKTNGQPWLDTLLGELDTPEAAEQSQALLVELYDISDAHLQDEDLTFSLLLPPDDECLNLRVGALGEWCQGFLAGLGFAGIAQSESNDDEIDEILADISEISKVDFDFMPGSEEDEVAYTEIVEYVRMAAILLFTEYQTEQASEPASNNQRLH